MILRLSLLALALFTGLSAIASDGRLLTPEIHLQMARLGAPEANPAGTKLAYTVSNLGSSGEEREQRVWLLDLQTGENRPLTKGPGDGDPRWDPLGKALYFLRDGRVWRLPMAGGEPGAITDLPLRVSGFRLNPDPNAPAGRQMAVSLLVHSDCPALDWDCTERARERWNERPGLVSELFPLRHWSSWRDSLEAHLFLGSPESNQWVDLTPGPASRPPFALAAGDDFSFSPDGKTMAVVRNVDPDVALSTNNDIFLVDLPRVIREEGTMRATRLLSPGLSGGGGNDDQPCFSPDGGWIAFTSMKRAGYESDLRQIVLHNLRTQEERLVTGSLDRSAFDLTWSHDSRFLYFTAYDREAGALYRIDVSSGAIQRLLRAGTVSVAAALPDGRLLVMLGSSRMPAEIFRCDPELLVQHPERWKGDLAPTTDGRFGAPGGGASSVGPLQQLTFHNWDRLKQLDMNPIEHFYFTGALGDSVHGMILRPPAAATDPQSRPEKLPLVLVFHGGPQWAYHDFWLRSYNFQMIAARGFVVATINFHGSTGFGVEFQDAIRGHWGGVPGEDVDRGLDYLLEHYDFVDAERVAGIGRSFGGYLVNWLNGQSDRFRCFVSHSGGFDEASGYGTTEELWFPEWEFHGTPWENAETYRANSPSEHASRMRTPTLIIHGQKDYRVDLSDGLQTYTTLRRQGVPARFLTFADQGHHIQQPRSWQLMWSEIFSWLQRHLG